MRNVLITLILVCGTISRGIAAEPEVTTEFHGRPVVRYVVDGERSVREEIQSKTPECVISKIGERYYWASRKNVPMLKSDGGGNYIFYAALNGSGVVKVRKTKDDFLGTDKNMDYVESLTVGLTVFAYYGFRLE